jgi:hypothetical protein
MFGSGHGLLVARSAWETGGRNRLVTGLLLFLLVVGIYYVGVKGSSRSAFNRWKPQVVEFWQGEDIYLRYGFPTPPVMVMILTPFSLLPGSLGMMAWFAFKSLLVVVVTVSVLRQVDRWSHPLPDWVVGLALLLASRPVMGDLLHGNVNLWIMGVVVAGIVLFQQGRDASAGMLLSLGVACKLTPALVLAYFVWKKQWLVVIWSLVGLLIWWVILPAAVLGWERNGLLWDHWADYMVRPYVEAGSVTTVQTNQSAVALLHRWFLVGEGVSVQTYAKALIACFLVFLAWICRTIWPGRQSPGWWHELGIVFLVMLMISERSWKHHFVWLLPIALVLGASAYGWYREGRHGLSMWMVGLMVGAFLSMLLTSQDFVRPWGGEAGAKMMQAWGAYVWASAFLITAHAISLRELRRTEVIVRGGHLRACEPVGWMRVRSVAPGGIAS